MNFSLLTDNLTNPALLFFLLGIIAVQIKSDLEIPENSAKFISLYLLFAIGFKGGQAWAHSEVGPEFWGVLLMSILVSLLVPLYTFPILKRKLNLSNAVAIAAAYGSVSAVTFVTAISFLELQNLNYNGYMVAMMALMEVPAIVIAVILLNYYKDKQDRSEPLRKVLAHSLTNGSVVLIIGSLIIGLLTSDKHALDIKPFTTDIFKGFLAIFLLDKGIESGKNLKGLFNNGWFTTAFAIVIPLINGIAVAYVSGWFITDISDRFLLSILAASASYIAVPAAMKMIAPKADSGLFIPMALAITFPFNITFGFPIYMGIIKYFS